MHKTHTRSVPLRAALCGVAAGAVNGLLGSGGGIILVPLFISWLGLEPKKAFATSVSVTVVFSMATIGFCVLTGDSLPVKAALPYAVGGLAGGIAAGSLLKNMPVKWLRGIFGALLIAGGIKTLL